MSTLKVGALQGISASSDAITLANDGTCTANITNNLSNRNLIINGAMQVAQRGTSFTDPTGAAYTLDRFAMQNSSGTPAFNVTQDSDAPHGFNKSLKVACTTADASPAAGSISRVYHYIEAQNMQGLAKGTSSAKACTLSFYVKTNKTGLYTVFVYDADNTRLMSGSYTVSNTDWNRYTILIPGDTTGVLDNGNGQGFGIFFGLSLGSGRTSGSLQSSFGSYVQANEHAGNVNFADNTSNVWAITGVQLEVGSVATDFEHLSFADELRRCQRYFHKSGDIGQPQEWFPGVATYCQYGAVPAKCLDGDQDRAFYEGNFPVLMRDQPTIVFYPARDGVANTAGNVSKYNSDTLVGLNTQPSSGCQRMIGYMATDTTHPAFTFQYTADAEL